MKLLTVRQVAELCSCSQKTIRRAIAAGLLVTRRVGRGIRVTAESVDRWTSGEPPAPTPPPPSAPPAPGPPRRIGRRILGRGIG